MFEDLLYWDAVRGKDATGVALVTAQKQRRVFKKGLNAADYLQMQGYQKTIRPYINNASLVIGHNRAATKGALDDICAHPFTERHITLVHNGFISNYATLKPEGMTSAWEVDSMAACWAIAEYGEKEALEKIRGAYALVWYNANDNTLNFARNDERPLWSMYVKDKKQMFFASEWEMIHAAMNRQKVEFGSLFLKVPTFAQIKISLDDPKEVTKTPFLSPQNQPTQIGTGGATKTITDIDPRLSRYDSEWYSKTLARMSKKEKASSGIPLTAKRQAAAAAKIKAHGIGVGQQILLHPEKYERYKNQKDRGVLIASKKSDAATRVEIPGCTSAIFERVKSTNVVYGSVVNLKKSPKGGVVLIAKLDYPLEPHKKVIAARKAAELPLLMHKTDGTGAEPMLKGPKGSLITRAVFTTMAQEGCGQCSSPIDVSRSNDCVWFGSELICHTCAADPKVQVTLGLAHPSILSKEATRH